MSGLITHTDHANSSVENLFPQPMLFPGESPVMYRSLRAALLLDLRPGTPYERALAQNMVTLEWEALRHRRMRDDLIRAKARDYAVGASATGEVTLANRYTEKDKALGLDLVGSDAKQAAAAAAALSEHGITVGEVMAKAYASVSGAVEVHEKKLAEIETRRRRLREDYDRLKSARARPIEDAEIVE